MGCSCFSFGLPNVCFVSDCLDIFKLSDTGNSIRYCVSPQIFGLARVWYTCCVDALLLDCWPLHLCARFFGACIYLLITNLKRHSYRISVPLYRKYVVQFIARFVSSRRYLLVFELACGKKFSFQCLFTTISSDWRSEFSGLHWFCLYKLYKLKLLPLSFIGYAYGFFLCNLLRLGNVVFEISSLRSGVFLWIWIL